MNDGQIEDRDLKETITYLANKIRILEEKIESLEDVKRAREEWLRDAKIEAGYDIRESFDNVWRDALHALQDRNLSKTS